MDLIIVESPTKAKTLGKFLGSSYSVEATMGHLKDLPKSTLGIDVKKNFEPEYVEVVKRADTIKKLKSESKKSNIIFLASDPDREGEAISQHVKEVLMDSKNKIESSKFKRISFHEITKEAVTEALANPREIDTNLVDAQIARRVLDRLVGYKLSPILWKKVRVGLSAGRVQSVAVRLIVEKEREIEKFKADEYWEIYATVKPSRETGELFTVQLVKIEDKAAEVKDQKTAELITDELKKSKYKISDVRTRQVVKSPYAPFTTSTLTQAGSRIFGWSSKKTMAVAQKLYEEGIITYHRTDSLNLSVEAVKKAREFITREYGVNYLPQKPRIYKTTSKVAQEAHEAIRPTEVGVSISNFPISNEYTEDGKKLYDLIWRRFVSCQMTSVVMDETTIDVSAGIYLLRTGGQILKFDGWRKVLPVKKDGGSTDVILPEVTKGEDLSLVKTWGDQKFTQPPPRYNEASLIKTLEKLGIGRPSTYAPTISTIQVRQYVEKNEGKFFPTSVGIAVTDFLVSNFPKVFDYDFTAGMEDDLDNIANGKHEWEKTIKEFFGPFDKKVTDVTKNAVRVKIEVEKLNQPCPECKEGELVIRTGRFGKFISCSRFPDCKYTAKYLLKIGVICPDCKKGDVIIKKTGKGRKFFGCSRYPDCKYASWKSPKREDGNEENEKN